MPISSPRVFRTRGGRLATLKIRREYGLPVRMIALYICVLASVWQKVLAASDACSTSLTISSQNDANNLTSCDTFEGSITVSSSFSGVMTLNNVEQIKGSFIAEGVSGLTAIVAPDLESLQGFMTLSNLDSLSLLTMGALSRISSGMTITENPKLKAVAFQELEEVDGQLELTGSFNSVSLPSLDQVRGQTTIKSSGSISCSALNNLRSQDVFRGSYSCSGGSSGLSPGAKGGIAVAVILGVLFILAILWLVLRRRRQKRGVPMARSSVSSTSSPSTPHAQKEKTPSLEDKSWVLQESHIEMPRKPVGSAIFLDSRPIHEAPNPSTPIQEYHELDAGPVLSSHQRPINSEY